MVPLCQEPPVQGRREAALDLLYAQHGHALTGESPECALMTGSI